MNQYRISVGQRNDGQRVLFNVSVNGKLVHPNMTAGQAYKLVGIYSSQGGIEELTIDEGIERRIQDNLRRMAE